MATKTVPAPEHDQTAPTNFILADSVTQLTADAHGRTVICGSHGGSYAGACAANCKVGGIILNDAGIGLESAGVAGLDILERAGIPAAAVGHLSAHIGDAHDSHARGVISRTNAAAVATGCAPGMSAAECATLMASATHLMTADAPLAAVEGRYLLRGGAPKVWALDSASLVRPEDQGDILITGSHGALVGGRKETALRVDALAVLFNDAGRGPNGSGTTRLPILDERAIAAATVDARSARIGDARSTYQDGVLSVVNACASTLGARPGMSAREFVEAARQRG